MMHPLAPQDITLDYARQLADGDIALIYCDRIEYVDRDFCQEVTHVATK